MRFFVGLALFCVLLTVQPGLTCAADLDNSVAYCLGSKKIELEKRELSCRTFGARAPDCLQGLEPLRRQMQRYQAYLTGRGYGAPGVDKTLLAQNFTRGQTDMNGAADGVTQCSSNCAQPKLGDIQSCLSQCVGSLGIATQLGKISECDQLDQRLPL